MKTWEKIGNDFESHIKGIKFPKHPNNLYQPIAYFLTIGGKRVRPILFMLVNGIYHGDKQSGENIASAIELFHNFTLLHDDLMDQSDLRRGKATIHKKWNANTAILSGDAMLIHSYDIINKTKSPYLSELLSQFNETALGVCAGQQLDLDYQEKDMVTTQDYLKMIQLKTAVLLGGAMKMAGIHCGVPEKQLDLLYKIGLSLGMAFQLKDDYLDTFGSEKTGKKIGSDLINSKKTYLITESFRLGSPEERKSLAAYLLSKNNPEEKIKALTKIIADLKVQEQCLQLANDYLQEAVKNISYLDGSSPYKQALIDFIEFLESRLK